MYVYIYIYRYIDRHLNEILYFKCLAVEFIK